MIKYISQALTFSEVPDEASLCLNITNCQYRCPGCHSPYLQQDTGRDLLESLPVLLQKYGSDITCVCFMGEGNDPQALVACLQMVREHGLKTCLYTGGSGLPLNVSLHYLDYLKIGPYIAERGGLDKPTTNQRMYRIERNMSGKPGDPSLVMQNITDRFWPQD